MGKTSSKVAALEVRKKTKVIEHMKKFSIKIKDELDLLVVYFSFIKDRFS
jgi:hypothetical protein